MSAAVRILALNCGSSSLKFGVYERRGETCKLLVEGEAEEVGGAGSQFWKRLDGGERQAGSQPIANYEAAFRMALQAVGEVELSAVGHRVVHGGPGVREHVRLDAEVLQQLRDAVAFAPLHLPPSLSVMDAVEKSLPGVPQVVCLDTAFHRALPDVAKTLPFPEVVRQQGVERYGFHGLSLESIAAQLENVPERIVVAHLGNGASVTALRAGKSVDTSMGLTPAGGVMMGTRSGDLDPGVMIYLLRHGFDADGLETLINHEAGLKGVSGGLSDVRKLSEARKTDANCDLALRMFAYQVKKAIAGMAAALGGLDLLVFTGGIGEHAADVRAEICDGLSCLDSFEIKVLPAQEDLQIARITQRVLQL